jgi:hypothetical protein
MHVVKGALPTVNVGPARPVAALDTGYVSPVKPTFVDQRPVRPGLRGSTILHQPGTRNYSPIRVYSPGRLAAAPAYSPATNYVHATTTAVSSTLRASRHVVSPVRRTAAYSPSRVIVDPVPRAVHPAPPTPPRQVSVMPPRYVGTNPMTRQPYVGSSPTHLRSYVDGVSTTHGNPGKLRYDNGSVYDTRNYY